MLVAGCGDEKQTPQTELEPELRPGEVELDASGRSLGTRDQPQGEIPMLIGASPTPTRSPPSEEEGAGSEVPLQPSSSAGIYQTFLDASDREMRARCVCRFAELGHASAEVCFENLRRPDFAKRCELGAFALYSRELGPRYDCFARARDASASCIETNGCAGIADCEATRDAARRQCGGLQSADIGFLDFEASCERPIRLGAASGCPDAVVGARLGPSVFEGNTTGAGDDVTLSCRPDFDEFGSPDLIVQWQAPAAGRYLFSTENSAFVTQLGILNGCGGSELGCASSSGDRFGGAALSLQLAAQQTVSIVLEGYEVLESGYVRLAVQALPSGQ